jgi:hypothetical protein
MRLRPEQAPIPVIVVELAALAIYDELLLSDSNLATIDIVAANSDTEAAA